MLKKSVSKRGFVDENPYAITNDPEFLVTVTPVRVTALGSRALAVPTAFWTSEAAMSRSRPKLKVQRIVLVPSLALVDEIYRRPSTPLIASSSGVVTEDSTVVAVAPV